jgi:hypothetical protein
MNMTMTASIPTIEDPRMFMYTYKVIFPVFPLEILEQHRNLCAVIKRSTTGLRPGLIELALMCAVLDL